MLLNIKKFLERGRKVALEEWQRFNRYKGNILNDIKSDGSYNPRLQKKYKRIYEDYWLPTSRAKRFHVFNDIRTRYICNTFYQDQKLDRVSPKEQFCGVKVLVVGCSGGILTETLAELNFHVTGIDPDPYFIVIAKHHQEGNKLLFGKKLQYIKATVEEFSETNFEKFDAVIISNVLEYDINFWHKRNFLRSCVRCCKPKGNILITTVDSSFRSLLWSVIMDTEPFWNAVNHRWFNGTNPSTLQTLLGSLNCQVMETRGIQFLPREPYFVPDDEIRTWYFLQAMKKASSKLKSCERNHANM